MSSDLTGKVIKGYHLQKLIGTGGFGAIYQAFQPSLARSVAIKVVLPEYANHPEFIRNFESEAQLIARLEHLHIVPLYDYWREPDNAYLVMRWMRGGSLNDSLVQHGPWPPAAAARLLDQIAAALALAHQHGVIHRDIKPGNILLDEQGNAYLTDFGIAKVLVENEVVVRELQLVGTPAYLAPEVMQRGMTSTKSDIYSLGIVLYEVLTGTRPFFEDEGSTTINTLTAQPIPALHGLEPDLAWALNAVIWRATDGFPAARYDDALEMAEDFRRAAGLENAPRVGRDGEMLAVPSPELTRPFGDSTVILEDVWAPPNPYKGLRAFEQADAADFFGRAALITRLIDRLEGAEKRFLAVVGPSGSGKSSVVKAGLIPELRAGRLPGSGTWFMAEMVPGSDPWQTLTAALLGVAVRPAGDDLQAALRSSDEALRDTVGRILPDDKKTELLLVIDQFEELFTLVENESDRLHLLSSLALAVTSPESRLRVVITLRGDFYDRPLRYAKFGDLMRDATEVVLPLSPAELVQAIAGPAERLGMSVEENLIASIVADVNAQPASLPLLQYALTELFEHREDSRLTQAAYQASGGVLGALARRAEAVYEGQDSARRAVTKQLFLRLVAMRETQEGSRRRVRWSELTPIADAEDLQSVLDLFGKHRLLTFDRDPDTREPTVEVAHEALLREWQRLREWLEDSRENLLTYRRLTEAVAEWQRSGRDPSFLVSGTRLAQFEALANGDFSLSEVERQYVQACIVLRQRSVRRLRLFIATLILLLAAALVLAGLSIDRENRALAARDEASEQASLARSRELAALALSNDNQLDLALLLSLEALRASDSFESRNSLLTLIQAQPQLLRIVHPGAAVRTVAYRPDGSLLAAGGSDNAITLWNVATGQQVGAPLEGHNDVVNGVDFSPDGALLASGSHDGTVRLWTLDQDGDVQAVRALTGHSEGVWSVAFNPDGSLLASGSADDTVRLWDVASGEPLGEPLVGHTDEVFSVAFSPDGRLLASGGADAVVRVWDVTTGEQVAALSGVHTNWIAALAFSPDGQLLVTASYDTTLQLWSVQNGEPLGQPLTGHTDWVRSVAFNPDGTQFVSSGGDGRVILWDLTSWPPQPLQSLAGQRDSVWSARFSPDGQQVASASLDGTVWLWEPGTDLLADRVIAAHDEPVARVIFSPDGRYIASASSGTETLPLRLWDSASGSALDSEASLPASITDIAFNPDGRTLAAADAGGSLFVWTVTDEGELVPDTILANAETGARGVIFDLAFAPGGQWLAAAQDRGRVALWNMTLGTLEREFTSGDDPGSIFSVAFSPDGHLLAAAGELADIFVWDVETGQEANDPLAGHDDAVTALSFSPDGRYLASASRDTTIGLWDVASGTLVGRLAGHADWVEQITFSPGGRLLASSGADGVVILWDVATQRPLGLPLSEQGGRIDWIAFSPDGRVLAVGGSGGSIVLWEMDLARWQQRACQEANRDLSPAEWRQFFPDVGYRATCSVTP